MKKLNLLLLAPLVFLVSCTTTSVEICDPANENLGILDKMSCNFSGNYQDRVDQKKQILLDEQKTNQQFKEIYASIEKQKTDTSLTVKQKQAQQQKLKNSLNQLTSELKDKAKGRQDLLAQVNDIDKQLNKVNNSNSSEIEKQVELDKLTNKLQSLQKALSL